jgi:hypothetical protein
MPRIAASFFLLLVSTLAAVPAWAQPGAAAVCPDGNLLAGKKPSAWQDTRRDLGMLTDETVAPEGAMWDAPPAVLLDTGASTVTWDLGEVTVVRALSVQADANDTYTVWGSLDGKDYKALGLVDPATGHGLRTRTLNVPATVLRFLRIGEGQGDSFYSVSEVTAYCNQPTPFPPTMKVTDAPVATATKTYLDYWNNDTTARMELILAVLGALLLWWERRSIRVGAGAANRRVRKILLGVMGVLGFLMFFNFGFWHFPNFVHGWDTFHYYIGSKYFSELHYERLYECVAIADSEEPGLRRRVELRKLTNLQTNLVETTADILAHPERCKQHFSDARWKLFKDDLRYFRSLEAPRRWDDAQTDHGFNGTPVWNILGTILTNLAPASKFTVYLLDSIDVTLITIMAAMVWWAFGWRVFSVAFIVFATNYPSRWYWIGGSYLRWDWLFWMVTGICLLKKERPLWAGVALSYATMLRIFPGFLFVAPLIAAVVHYVKTRELDRRLMRLFVGAALAVVVLVPVSFAVSGGLAIYSQFVRNTVKHSQTPLTNHMGLRTVVAFRPSQTSGQMNAPSLTDPWSRWKAARLKSFHEAMPLYIGLVICYLTLIGLALRGVELWVMVALSSTVIAFGAELTCYYYAFLIIPAFLYAKVPRAGEWLMWLTALTQFVGWAPFQKVPKFLQNLMPASIRQSSFVQNLAMPTALDEQYTWMSLATLIVFVMIAWEMMAKQKVALEAETAVPAVASGQEAQAVKNEVLPPAASPVPQGAPDAPARFRKKKRRR